RTPQGSGHLVHFYAAGAFPDVSVGDFLWEGLSSQESAVILATPEHASVLERRLAFHGAELDALRATDRLICSDARTFLEAVMVGGLPDNSRFAIEVSAVLDKVAAAAPNGRVRVFAETSALLIETGNVAATMAIEQLCNELLCIRPAAVYCPYPIE